MVRALLRHIGYYLLGYLNCLMLQDPAVVQELVLRKGGDPQ